MKFNPRIHHRRSIRLKGYNYDRKGNYFITINCHNKQHLFGEITDGKMILNEFGMIAYCEWIHTPVIRPYVKLGEYVIMPDHIHGIMIITDDFKTAINKSYCAQSFISPSGTIGAIIRGYMGTVTSQINYLRKSPGEKVWQRNYHDHIIRNKWSFHRITNYIRRNPQNF